MTDVPNKHIGFARVLLVYVGLAQARPNKLKCSRDAFCFTHERNSCSMAWLFRVVSSLSAVGGLLIVCGICTRLTSSTAFASPEYVASLITP